jgi:hypothetical protein
MSHALARLGTHGHAQGWCGRLVNVGSSRRAGRQLMPCSKMNESCAGSIGNTWARVGSLRSVGQHGVVGTCGPGTSGHMRWLGRGRESSVDWLGRLIQVME